MFGVLICYRSSSPVSIQAYKLGMYGADYAWILHETMGPPWWQQSLAECSQWELEQAVENLIIVSSHNSIVGGESSISGLVSSDREQTSN